MAAPLPILSTTSGVALVLVDDVHDDVEKLRTCEHSCRRHRQPALTALREAAGLPPAAVAERAVGAIVPVLVRAGDETRRTVALCHAVVAAVGSDAVVVAVRAYHERQAYDVLEAGAPAPTTPADAFEAVIALLAGDMASSLDEQPDADALAAATARFLAESGTRGVLEDILRADLAALERYAARTLDVESRKPEELAAALKAARSVPRELQKLRAGLGSVAGKLDEAARERVAAWRFGVDWSALDPADPPPSGGWGYDLHRAHAHVAAAAELAVRVRVEAVDVLATADAVTSALTAAVAEQTSKASQDFAETVSLLTAALAGPGLLFSLWALDAFGSPWWSIVVVALVAAALLVGIWELLNRRRQGDERRMKTWHLAFSGAIVATLVLLALLVPGLVSDPPPNEKTSEAVQAIEDDADRQANETEALRRDIRALREELRRLGE